MPQNAYGLQILSYNRVRILLGDTANKWAIIGNKKTTIPRVVYVSVFNKTNATKKTLCCFKIVKP